MRPVREDGALRYARGFARGLLHHHRGHSHRSLPRCSAKASYPALALGIRYFMNAGTMGRGAIPKTCLARTTADQDTFRFAQERLRHPLSAEMDPDSQARPRPGSDGAFDLAHSADGGAQKCARNDAVSPLCGGTGHAHPREKWSWLKARAVTMA